MPDGGTRTGENHLPKSHVSPMRTTTIRELKHDTTTVLSWVAGGESVEVRRRGAVMS